MVIARRAPPSRSRTAPSSTPRGVVNLGASQLLLPAMVFLLSLAIVVDLSAQSSSPGLTPPGSRQRRRLNLSAASPVPTLANMVEVPGSEPLFVPAVVDDRVARGALQRFYKQADTNTPHPGVLSALSELAGFDHPLIVDELLELLGHGRPYLRPTARRVLSTLSSPASLERIARAGLGHREAAVREQVLLALADGRPAGLDWLSAAESALQDEQPRVRAAAVRAVGLGRSRSSATALIELADDPSQRVRMAVPKALVRLAGRRALPVLRNLARDGHWRVRVGVVSALVDLKTQRAVAELIDMLGREQGRVREDILKALKTLTGKTHGLNLKAWERFLELAPADYLSRADAASLGQDRPRTTVARYYGLWTLSTRFLFVTDLSTSMDHVDAGRYGDTPGVSRLSLTQQELAQLVEDLGEEVQFNLATFSDKTTLWRDEMTQASKRNKSAALKQIDHYHTIGGTNIFSSLQAAFDLAEAQLDATGRPRAAPDTVFLLTDGEPSTGKLTDVDLLLEYVAERNRVLGLRFQCVALTRQPLARGFLVLLAEGSGGQFVSPLD